MLLSSSFCYLWSFLFSYQFFVFVRSYILLYSSFLCLYLWSFRDFQRHQFFILFNLLPFSFFPIPLFSHLHVVPMLPSFDYISIITRQLFFLFHSLGLPSSSPFPVSRRCLSCFSFFLLRPSLLRTSLFLYPAITLIDPPSSLSRSFHLFFVFPLLSRSFVFPISVIFDGNYLRTGVSTAEAPALNSRFTGELYTG